MAWLVAPALGAEAELPGPAAQIKEVASSGGIYGPLLALALTAIVTLFTLLMRSTSGREAALKGQALEYERQIKDKDDQHAKDRAEWFTSLQVSHEARAALMREVLTAVGNGTAVISENTRTLAMRNQTADDVTAALRSVVSAVQSQASSQADELTSMARRVKELTELLEAVSKRLSASA